MSEQVARPYEYWSERYNIKQLINQLERLGCRDWIAPLLEQYRLFCHNQLNGKTAEEVAALECLLQHQPQTIQLSDALLKFGEREELDDHSRAVLRQHLKNLSPWRKGPFSVFGITIDAEWRGNLKWDRVAPILGPLEGKTVLDVGCGNGYYALRMFEAGADFVLGIDGNPLCTSQFLPFGCWLSKAVWVLPARLEAMPEKAGFDQVLAMGTLAHQRNPLKHLSQLAAKLAKGGRLLIETLIIDDLYGHSLIPQTRYANMRNIWVLPSAKKLEQWLEASGFTQIEFLSSIQTDPEEQRSTEWMNFYSLTEALNPKNPNLTVEGYPAPLRAIFTARRPN